MRKGRKFLNFSANEATFLILIVYTLEQIERQKEIDLEAVLRVEKTMTGRRLGDNIDLHSTATRVFDRSKDFMNITIDAHELLEQHTV